MYALMLCVLPLAGGAEPPKEDAVKMQYEKLQGTWKFVSIELDGKVTVLPQAPPDFDFVITGNKFAFGKREGEIVLNAVAKPPAIDLRYTEATVVGIYKIDGDTLSICMRRGKADAKVRPTEFVTKGNDQVEIRVYKLEKPKK